ncbi:hypothetical protein [Dankookia rubra]|uniref:hypothetical protein n=1 Tax=Dankookia rubra TaxID=1442381 RepID=UPI001F4F9318|nr:hypothetical protein [Dankookia rubra]
MTRVPVPFTPRVVHLTTDARPSDIPNDWLMRWDEEAGAISRRRKPAGYLDGITRDRRGGSLFANSARAA